MFKKIRKALSGLVLVALAGCSYKLVLDPYPQAVKSRYYNVEFSINDTKAQGGSALLVDKSSSPSDYNLQVYGPDRGVIYLASKRCGVDKSVTYSKGKHASFSLGDLFSSFKNCTLEITVVPSYDEWKHDKVSVAPHQGVLYLRVLPENSDHVMKVIPSNFFQIKDRDEASKFFLVESKNGTKLAAFHCMSSEPYVVKVDDPKGIVMLDTKKFHKPGSGCLVQLKDKNGGFSVVMINPYNSDYQALAQPSVEVSKGKLRVEGEKYVALTDINGKAFHGTKATVKYTPGITYRIRQYTTKGRAIVCDFNEGKLNCNR